MKPQELYQQWSQFEAMIESKSLSNADKVKLGEEWVKALPPKLLCTSSQLSYEVVHNSMTGRLKDIKELENGSTTPAKKEKTERDEKVDNGPREEPIREDATDGRGKNSVENLDRPKKSKPKR